MIQSEQQSEKALGIANITSNDIRSLLSGYHREGDPTAMPSILTAVIVESPPNSMLARMLRLEERQTPGERNVEHPFQHIAAWKTATRTVYSCIPKYTFLLRSIHKASNSCWLSQSLDRLSNLIDCDSLPFLSIGIIDPLLVSYSVIKHARHIPIYVCVLVLVDNVAFVVRL